MNYADPQVKMEHVLRAGYCVRGARAQAARYGLDYTKFVMEGYPASVIEAKCDGFGKKVARLARREAAALKEKNNG